MTNFKEDGIIGIGTNQAETYSKVLVFRNPEQKNPLWKTREDRGLRLRRSNCDGATLPFVLPIV